jgi:fumarylacetoacetate (FAA) hydrolase family protein
MDHILGYCVSNDVTMRDYQNKSHQWLQGKIWDNTTPLGPHIVTPAESDISKVGISTTLNGEVVQKSDLSHLIFSIPTLIATISEFTTLEPGDVILTGTPAGVGYRRHPQLFLKDGDTVTVTVEGAGVLQGLGSARPDTTETYTAENHTSFDGRLLAVVRPTTAGEITVHVRADGFEPVTVSLTASAADAKEAAGLRDAVTAGA